MIFLFIICAADFTMLDAPPTPSQDTCDNYDDGSTTSMREVRRNLLRRCSIIEEWLNWRGDDGKGVE